MLGVAAVPYTAVDQPRERRQQTIHMQSAPTQKSIKYSKVQLVYWLVIDVACL